MAFPQNFTELWTNGNGMVVSLLFRTFLIFAKTNQCCMNKSKTWRQLIFQFETKSWKVDRGYTNEVIFDNNAGSSFLCFRAMFQTTFDLQHEKSALPCCFSCDIHRHGLVHPMHQDLVCWWQPPDQQTLCFSVHSGQRNLPRVYIKPRPLQPAVVLHRGWWKRSPHCGSEQVGVLRPR